MFHACVERFDVMSEKKYFGLGWGSEQGLREAGTRPDEHGGWVTLFTGLTKPVAGP
jgi:hypothetical protein